MRCKLQFKVHGSTFKVVFARLSNSVLRAVSPFILHLSALIPPKSARGGIRTPTEL